MIQPNMSPVDKLADVDYIQIGPNRHPRADAVVSRAHRDSTDRGYYFVGSDIEILVPPMSDNGMMCIVKAIVSVMDGDGNIHKYSDLGDACPTNCSSANTAAAYPRMAATRAIGRALSQALNIPEAMAEEMLANGQTAVAASHPATVSPPAQGSNGFSIPAWKYTVPGNKHPKGTRIDSPAVQVEDLEYWIDKLYTKNSATGQYDVPDPDRVVLFREEIARRRGAVLQSVTPTPEQVPDYNGQSAVAPSGAKTVTQAHVLDLIQLGKANGKSWPEIKKEAQDNFGSNEPIKLDWDSFNMLRVIIGGNIIP